MKHEQTQELIERLRQWADGDVREIGRDLVNGVVTPDARDFEKWAKLMEDGAAALSSLLEENKRMKEAFGEVFFEWLHLHDVADSMDLAACVEIEDHEKFEAACHRARSALKEVGND